MAAPHVVIVGAGIAGASAAYFARRQGARVTIIDAGDGTASRVPVALVNPVRGTGGKIVKGGFEAARFTFELVDTLISVGHEVQHGRGVYRPVPNAATRADWEKQLPAGSPAQWVDIDPTFGLKGEWHSALFLPEAGWVDTASVLQALLSESKATILNDEVTAIDAQTRRLTLLSGERLQAEILLWCGGARGAALTGAGLHTYRPGSVLRLEQALSEKALSYGLYAAPSRDGTGVVGSTSEPRANTYNMEENQWALARLKTRVAGMWGVEIAVGSTFRGVRLGRNTPAEIPTLDGFGSRGYLLAPRAAFEWAIATIGKASVA
jgi:glycine/D-amino acid oxidase-like deaminating enzyme